MTALSIPALRLMFDTIMTDDYTEAFVKVCSKSALLQSLPVGLPAM